MSLYEIHLRTQLQIIKNSIEKPTIEHLRHIYFTKGWTSLSIKQMQRIEFKLFGRHFSERERMLEINKCNSKFIIENFLKEYE